MTSLYVYGDHAIVLPCPNIVYQLCINNFYLLEKSTENHNIFSSMGTRQRDNNNKTWLFRRYLLSLSLYIYIIYIYIYILYNYVICWIEWSQQHSGVCSVRFIILGWSFPWLLRDCFLSMAGKDFSKSFPSNRYGMGPDVVGECLA